MSRLLGQVSALERSVGRTIEHIALCIEAASMAGTIPAAFRQVPSNLARHVRANGGESGHLARLVAIDGQPVASNLDDASFARANIRDVMLPCISQAIADEVD